MDLQKILAVITITGFAIQQIIEIFDPLISKAIKHFGKQIEEKKTLIYPAGLSEREFKKSALMILSFILGLIVVGLTEVRMLTEINPNWGGLGDFIITALVISAGTDGLNTATKYFGYAKNSKKPIIIEVEITPGSIKVRPESSFQFFASVSNTKNRVVTWKVLNSDGGKIDPETGLYSAPTNKGVYQIIAISAADNTKADVAKVTVK